MINSVSSVIMLCLPTLAVENELSVTFREFSLVDVELHAHTLLLMFTDESFDVGLSVSRRRRVLGRLIGLWSGRYHLWFSWSSTTFACLRPFAAHLVLLLHASKHRRRIEESVIVGELEQLKVFNDGTDKFSINTQVVGYGIIVGGAHVSSSVTHPLQHHEEYTIPSSSVFHAKSDDALVVTSIAVVGEIVHRNLLMVLVMLFTSWEVVFHFTHKVVERTADNVFVALLLNVLLPFLLRVPLPTDASLHFYCKTVEASRWHEQQ